MLIAVPLTDEDFENRVKEVREKGGDIVELRVDTFRSTDLDYVKDHLDAVHTAGLKTILTVRIPEEGGREVENRHDLLENLAPLSDYTDIELIKREDILRYRDAIKSAGKELIISFHDFERTPPAWLIRETLREAHRYGGIPKVSVKANSHQDVATLLCVGAKEPYPKILIAMGETGKISRVAGFIAGSVISYASLGESLAPGQLPLEKMVELRELLCEGCVEDVGGEVK